VRPFDPDFDFDAVGRRRRLACLWAVAAFYAAAIALAASAPPASGQTTRPAAFTARPAVPVLAWDVPVGDMNKWKARGVNVLIGAGMEGKKDQAELDAWAAAAADRGLWVIVNPLASRPYPNLYAFLLPDEMDAKQADPAVAKWDGLRPDQIKPLFDAFRKIDPTIPVFMSLSGAKITGGNRAAYYKSISPFCDVWMEDGYPRNMNAARYDESLWPGKACAVLKQAAPDKPLVAMIEVDDQNLWNSPLGRGPTVDEVAEALRQAKANGATGYGVFGHYFSDAGGWAGWDRTPADIAGLLTAEFGKLNPPADDPLDALRDAVGEARADASAANARAAAAEAKADAANAELARIRAIFRDAAATPAAAQQPGQQ
jgi:hypothetical protein